MENARWRQRGTDTEGRQPHEGGGRGWSLAATNHGSPGASRSWTRHRKEPSAFRGHVAGPTPYYQTSSLQSCEKINVCCLKPCSLRFYYGNARTLIQEECGEGLDPGLSATREDLEIKENTLVPRKHRNSVWGIPERGRQAVAGGSKGHLCSASCQPEGSTLRS